MFQVHIDESGVYVTHTHKLAKYSLEGALVWAVDAPEFLCTASVGSVLFFVFFHILFASFVDSYHVTNKITR